MRKEDSYAEKQLRRNVEHKHSYEKWFAGLSPKKQEELRKQGLDKCPVDTFPRRGGEQEEEQEAIIPDPHSLDGFYFDELDGTVKESPEVPPGEAPADQTWSYLRPMLGLIIDSDNPMLTAQCLCIAAGMSDFIGGMSESEVARRHRLTRAAVSKRVKQLTDRLGLRPSRAMRPAELCKKYRESRYRSLEKKHGNHQQHKHRHAGATN